MIVIDAGQDSTDKLEEDHQILVSPNLSPPSLPHKPAYPLHHMGMPTRMDACHLDAQLRVCLDGDGFAGVLRGYVVKELAWWKGSALFRVAGYPDTWGLVVFVVGYGEVKGFGLEDVFIWAWFEL